MRPSFAAALLVSLGLAGCAPRAEPAPSTAANAAQALFRVGCRQGECSWMRVIAVEMSDPVAQGQLRRVRAWRGRSVHGNGPIPAKPPKSTEWEAEEISVYAFCSVQRPAYAFPDESGKLIVHFLDLFDLAGFQLASADTYMRICHALDRVPDPETLRSIGYRPGTRDDQVEDADVETLTRF